MFPLFVQAIRDLEPKAILVENVKGLMRRTFAKYLEYIFLMLSYPEVLRKSGDTWLQHKAALERHHTGGREKGLHYRVVFDLLNAANFGVPQKRERVFFVGFRSDLNIEWSFPEQTHTYESLLVQQWVTGEYWDRHCVASKDKPPMPDAVASRKDRLASLKTLAQPWNTVRDAIKGLPDPERKNTPSIKNHVFIPGARSYVGHTGSPLDEPAKTLKAGVHGVPGGENMLTLSDGRVRYFTVRESARLQTFPDEYVFCGAWGEAMRQIGNAVPVKLSEVIAGNIRRRLEAKRCNQSNANRASLQSAGEKEPRN
jgi:DNA (cytosine-5)-methyltransferase 1